MKYRYLISLFLVCVLIAVWGSTCIARRPVIPAVEVNARFKTADKNQDGRLDREEFEEYISRNKMFSAVGNTRVSVPAAVPAEAKKVPSAQVPSAKEVPVVACCCGSQCPCCPACVQNGECQCGDCQCCPCCPGKK
ncbi:MAG: hypothetical protein LBT89_11355 [Planctomycetaceae bacterium]|jgi:hypothetical protein|nr:hypothetical protein [Planctomycetaceae bacterium]